jgi:hypothetical protein
MQLFGGVCMHDIVSIIYMKHEDKHQTSGVGLITLKAKCAIPDDIAWKNMKYEN